MFARARAHKQVRDYEDSYSLAFLEFLSDAIQNSQAGKKESRGK
jgi:uncharacterized protein YecE (DUF72 family)